MRQFALVSLVDTQEEPHYNLSAERRIQNLTLRNQDTYTIARRPRTNAKTSELFHNYRTKGCRRSKILKFIDKNTDETIRMLSIKGGEM